MLTRIIVHGATTGSHHVITGTISSHQNIPPHKMVMVATDPTITSGRGSTGIGAPSALPARTMVLVLVRLTQATQVGEILMISALANDAITGSDLMVQTGDQDTATTAITLSHVVNAVNSEAATRIETIAGAISSVMSVVDETPGAARLKRTAEVEGDSRISAQAPVPAILAGRTVPGSSARRMNAQKDHIVQHITNASRATTSVSTDVMIIAVQGARRAELLVEDSTMTTMSERKSDMSRACQMAAYLRDHDLCSAKKRSSGLAFLRALTT